MYLYLMVAKPYMKIGISIKVNRRVKEVQTGCPVRITRVIYFDTGSSTTAGRIEKLLHERYRASNTAGEWFVYSKSRVKAIIDMLDTLEMFVEDYSSTYVDNNAQITLYKEQLLDMFSRKSLSELIASESEINRLTNKAGKRKLFRLRFKYITKLKRMHHGNHVCRRD